MEQEEVEACWGTPLFSLLTSQTREACERVPQHTQTHTHTHRSKTRALAQTQTCTTPTIYMHTSHRLHHFHHTQTHTLPSLFSTLSPATKHTRIHPPPTRTHPHTHTHTTKNYPTTISPSQSNPQGSTGPDWELSVMNRLMRSTQSAGSRQASFWRAICRYEYAWESVIQATSTTYIWCQRSPVWGVKLALCWAFGDM